MLVLASASPRRSELLSQLGLVKGRDFIVEPVDVDEMPLTDELPDDYVQRIANKKAQASFLQQKHQNTVLAADTTVTVEREILGKPKDFSDFKRIMSLLSGREHQVLTAVSILNHSDKVDMLSRNFVQFSVMDEQSIREYWSTEEPVDKAGGYAIQGIGARYIAGMRGSYTGIVGLPLYETAQLFEKFGI